MILLVLHLDLLNNAINDVGGNNFYNLWKGLTVVSSPVIEYFNIHGNVKEFPSVNVFRLQEAALDGKHIEVPQSLEVVPIIAWGGGKDGIERADQGRQREVVTAEGKGAST
jgi:hypothetical protein